MPAIIQPNFSAGEVSRRVQARVDLTKRTVAVARAVNGMVSVTGSLDKRPGTEYVDTTYGNDPARLIPFIFNRDQTYVLVFTDSRLEIYRDGVQREGIGSPYAEADLFDLRYAQYGDQMTIVHPDYAPRELLRSSDTSWSISTITFEPDQAHPTNCKVIPNARTAAIEVTSITKADPGVVTASAAHDLSDNDTVWALASLDMTGISKGFFKVNVTSTTEFELQDPEDNTDYDTTGMSTYTSGSFYPAPLARAYIVTAVNAATGEESLAGTSNSSTNIAGVNGATPANVFCSDGGHGFLTGDTVTFSSTGSILDGQRFTVTRVDNRNFTIQWMNGEDVDGNDVFESGGIVRPCFDREPRSLDGTTNETRWDNLVTWDKAADAVIYNVYASDGGAYGLVGSTTGKSFRDYYTTPDTSIGPPRAFDPFFDPSGGSARYPSAVAYHNQRRVFGNSTEFPNRVWMSQLGNYYNLSWSTPSKDDDAIVASIASSRANDIAHFLSLSELICLTDGGEFVISGGNEALTPSTIAIDPQSFYGYAGSLEPLVAGNIGLLHLAGNTIRDFEYTISSQTFVGTDLTILGRHLLDDRTFKDWTYAHAPTALVVLTMEDDYNCPMFTYFPEQEVYGWSRMKTDGDVVSVCSVPEGGFDRIYLCVYRGSTYYIERMALPNDDPYEYHGVDCGVRWEQTGVNVSTVAIESGTYVKVTTTSSHGLNNGDIVDISGVYEVGDDNVMQLSDNYNGDNFVVADATSTTFRLKDSDGAYIDGSEFPDFAFTSSRGVVREAVTTVGGLSHLNGETVVAAANGQDVGEFVVDSGSITLPSPASMVSVGYPFTYEVETLPVSSYQQGGTIEGVMKNVNRFALHVIAAAGFYAGPERDAMEFHEPPTEDNPHKRQTMMQKSQLVTVSGTWDRNRSLMLQQRSPLPMSIASIIPDALLGDV